MKKLALIGAVVIGIFTLSACSSEKNLNSNKNESKITYTSKENKESSGWDESTKTFTGDESIIKIDKVEKVTSSFDGAAAVKIYYTLTNNISKTQNVSDMLQSLMTVQQKSTNTTNDLSPIMSFSEAGKADEDTHQYDNVNPNGTISGFTPYKLENESDPIQISFFKNNEVVATYEVPLN